MTTSVRAGGVYGAGVPQRPLSVAPARSQEWQTLYQRQLAQEGLTAEGQDGSAQRARDAHAGAFAAQSAARRDDGSAPEHGIGSRPSAPPAQIDIESSKSWSASAGALASALSGSHGVRNSVGAAQADVVNPQSIPHADGRPKPDRYRVALIAAGEQAVDLRSPILPPRIDIEPSGLPKPAGGGEALARSPSGWHGASHGIDPAQTAVMSTQATVLSSQSALGAADRSDSDPAGIAVAAARGQLDVTSIATAASALLQQMKALPELAPARVTAAPSARDDRQAAAAAPTGWPIVPRQPESDRMLARALAAPAALALPAAVLAQAGGPPGSQQAGQRLSSAETPIDTVATSAIAARSAGAAAGAGAGTARQRGGDTADHQRSPRDAFSTGSGSGRHYGTFPLIVSGELLELDFVSLRAGRTPPAGEAVSRIFVSLQPPGMRRLELTAHHLGDRVTVSFGGQAVQGGAAPALDVSALLQRLGWGSYPVKVEGVIP